MSVTPRFLSLLQGDLLLQEHGVGTPNQTTTHFRVFASSRATGMGQGGWHVVGVIHPIVGVIHLVHLFLKGKQTYNAVKDVRY